ncbi:MAG: DUF177 domain-containing protein [bacterium]|nr:DUF177 domain-containing protein [bacterium]
MSFAKRRTGHDSGPRQDPTGPKHAGTLRIGRARAGRRPRAGNGAQRRTYDPEPGGPRSGFRNAAGLRYGRVRALPGFIPDRLGRAGGLHGPAGRALEETEGETLLILQRDGEVELAASLREFAALAYPQATVCREDCRGLCASCGADLNDGPCGCVEEPIDPRWAGLP